MTALAWKGEYAPRGYATALEVPAGRTTALVGPNGAGKSTTLALLAGLLTPTRGRLAVGEEMLVDSDRRVDVPAHRRRIALLGQDPLLFPHLRVLANVEFGPRSRGVPRREARRRATEVLERVDAAQFARRRPTELSGGQAARVALARALATDPHVVLLDEPFAALDVDVAPHLRRVVADELTRLGVPAVLVTHDLLDVLALADDIAVVDGGRIVEDGPVADVLRAPASAFAARFAGVNHIHGRTVEPGVLRTDHGVVVRGTAETELRPGGAAVAVWSPGAVALHRASPEGSPRNAWRGVVTDLSDRGGVVRVGVDLAVGVATSPDTGSTAPPRDDDPTALDPASTGRSAPGFARPHGSAPGRVGPAGIWADLSPASVRDLALSPGVPVYAVVEPQEVHLHPLRSCTPARASDPLHLEQ